MAKRIELTREECRVALAEFYATIGSKLGLSDAEIKEVCYDCREICITHNVQTEIIKHYYKQGWTVEQTGMLLLCFGAKASLDGDGYFAEVEDGFIVRKEI